MIFVPAHGVKMYVNCILDSGAYIHIIIIQSTVLIGQDVHCTYILEASISMILPQNTVLAGQDVRCISDSGSLYPYDTHTKYCDPEVNMLIYFSQS